ncbi:MAG: hypothetical protein J6T70_13585 [Bacteroidales bacterium]|nr:hypothetical protein [Bacteroidales bacterium]
MDSKIIKYFFVSAAASAYFFILVAAIGQCADREETPPTNFQVAKQLIAIWKTDSVFLNQVAEAFIETKYDNPLVYCYLGSYPNTLYDLKLHKPLKGSFPKISNLIKKEYPNIRDIKYLIWYTDNMVFFREAQTSRNVGNNKNALVYIYTEDSLNIKIAYPEYKILNKKVPTKASNWIARFQKNWYIFAPDHCVYNGI